MITLASFVPTLSYAQTPPASGAPQAEAAPEKAPAKPAVKVTGKTPLARGQAYLKAEEYAAALEEFKAANAEKETPEGLLGQAKCQDALKDYPAAVASYEKFLSAVPKAMIKDGEAAKARSAEIQQMPATLKFVSVPEGATVTVDEKVQEAKTPSSIEVPPGKHVITFSLKGHDDLTQEVEASFASTVDVNAELKETPVAAPEPAPAPVVAKPEEPPPPVTKPRSKIPAYVTGGIAVLALGVGTGFGIRALAKKGEFDDNPSEDVANSGENSALIADMAFGVALTFGITSAVLFLAKDEPRATAAAKTKRRAWKLTPTPYVNQHGGGAGALVHF